MDYELTAKTLEGERLVELAEELASDFATRAGEHDRAGTFPFENIERLRESAYLYSPFPAECGGLGVEPVHDVVVAASRLARGDASTTIASNMHLIGAMGLRRTWSTGVAAGKDGLVQGALEAMANMARERHVYAAAVSEPSQDLSHPATTATRTDRGWTINGRKIFGTMSPAATHFNVAVTYEGADGLPRYAYAQVPAKSPGIILHDDWDPLGMRASGSGSITFDEVEVASSAVGKGFPAGIVGPELLDNFLVSGAMHAAASLGIAEAALMELQAAACGGAVRSHGSAMADRPIVQILAGEISVDLAAMRGALSHAAGVVDRYYATHPAGRGDKASAQSALAEVQAVKVFVTTAATRVVDRALAATGGASFMNRHPLSRLYRDARAGGFMHPFAANVALPFVGQAALGSPVVLR